MRRRIPRSFQAACGSASGFARALVVEPEVLFMDEPFSALDVLTAENLRSELLELWAKKTMPTKAVFLVTHNIEEAVLLADRIIVLGRNPGHIRTDFPVQLPQPRDRKSEAFTQLVDYIYKVLTRPDAAPAEAPEPAGRAAWARPAADALPDAAACAARRHCRPARAAARSRAGATISTAWPTNSPSKSTICCPSSTPRNCSGFSKSKRATPPSLPAATEFANSEILRQKELFRNAAVENVLLLRQIRRALDTKSDHTVPEDFFLDMLDEQFSEEESQRQTGNRRGLGPLRGVVRLRCRAPPLCAARRAGRELR